MKPNPSLLLIGCLVLSGCSSLNLGKKPAQITANTAQTSYDYTKPGDIDRQGKPVWILPQVTGGWKKATADDSTGEWRSGQYVAKVVTPGHWATLEEAELSGKPYILPNGGGRPIVPTPMLDQSPTKTGEISVTGIEQKIANLEKMSRNASTTSIGNQAAIPPTPNMVSMDGPRGPQPGLDLQSVPGLRHEPRSAPSPTPFSLAVQPPTITPQTPTPEKVAPKMPDAPPLSLPGTKTPIATYDAKSKSVVVGYAPPGESFKVQTPQGEVSVDYKEGGHVNVTFAGKTITTTSPPQTGSVRIDLGAG